MKKNLSNHQLLHFFRTALTRVSIVFLFLPSLIFLVVFLVMYSITQGVKQETASAVLPQKEFSSFRPAPYPILETQQDDPLFENMWLASTISAQGAVVMDEASKIVLFKKNPTIPFIMASTTKIMTALVALDHYKLDAILTVASTDVPPAIVGYSLGEKVRFIDMLYGMMLPSGNDAALAVAQNYPGGEKAFVQQMNIKAKALSLSHTHFSDSSGLDNGNYTTVEDLARLTAVALQNPLFAKVVSTKQKRTTNAAGSKVYSVTNINQLLGTYGVIGVKTGFTPDAGGVLVTASRYNGHTIVYVVMKSDDRFGDTEKLLQATYGHVHYVSFTP